VRTGSGPNEPCCGPSCSALPPKGSRHRHPGCAAGGRVSAAVNGAWSPIVERYGITVADRASPIGVTMHDLTRIALRRNPKRAQLLVSTVLGKHLPVDPRVAAGAGRLLGALVA